MSIILVTNDDGYDSSGINSLFDVMSDIGEPYIVAPDRERSGAGHSLTLDRPLKINKLAANIFSINGTPTDCVTLALNRILPRKPDLVVAGINRGANLGDDISYSGTVSAAVEGTIFCIPSIAFSLNGIDSKYLNTAALYAKKISSYVLSKSLPYDTLLNVNIPNIPPSDVKGIKYTRQGKRIYENAIQDNLSPWGEPFFWIGGGRPLWEHGEDTDINAIQNSYISVTPLHLDMTNYDALSVLRNSASIDFDISE